LSHETLGGERLDTLSFFNVHCQKDLRQGIINLARSFCRDKAGQEALLFTAWLSIADMDEGWLSDAYMAKAYGAMSYKYATEYADRDRFPSDDPGIRRGRKKIKKFYKKRRSTPPFCVPIYMRGEKCQQPERSSP